MRTERQNTIRDWIPTLVFFGYIIYNVAYAIGAAS